MWNVFDTAFVVTTALYLILRYKGLSSGNCELYLVSTSDSSPHLVGPLFTIASASDLGFDILACGACILFPRSDSYLFYFGVDLQLPGQACVFLGLKQCCDSVCLRASLLYVPYANDADIRSSLRAMTAEFVFFIVIASVCFSGLLFTLWTLASDKWTIKSITWLMVQIWFGNTSLSFGQASSFHPCKFYYHSVLTFSERELQSSGLY